jgi:uncharacterized protein
MSHNKKMTSSLLAILIVVFIVAVGVWWYAFFGRPNPPLPRASATVQSSMPSGASAQVMASGSVAATGTASTGEASATIVSGENPPLAAEPLAIDGVTFNVEVASTALEQTRGLSFRPSLGANDGMLFIFDTGSVQTFWMKDMNFPLDMIWISGNTVAGFAQDVPAPAPGVQLWQLPIYSSPGNTDKVLEVNAGTVAKYNIKVGDSLTIGPME